MKNFKKILATVLSIIMLLSCVVPAGFVMAEETNVNTDNLLAGKIPTDFYDAAIGTPKTCNYKQIDIANSGSKHPYLYNWTDQKQNIQDYIATATDNDTTAGNAYALTRSLVLIYELDALSKLNGFEIKIGSHVDGEKNAADVKVYTATERSALFANDPAATMNIQWGNGAVSNLGGLAKFVAVVIEKNDATNSYYFAIKDIALYGESNVTNALAGNIPVEFYHSTLENPKEPTWSEAYGNIGTSSYFHAHGYSPRKGYQASQYDYWKDYVAMNTDEDTTDGLSYKLNRGFVWVYELDGYSAIDNLTVDFSTFVTDTTNHTSIPVHFEVYASKTLDNGLFDEPVAEGDFTDDSKVSLDLSEKANYIAVVAERIDGNDACSIRINDIFLVATVIENVISGKIPVEFYRSDLETPKEPLWRESSCHVGTSAYPSAHGYSPRKGYQVDQYDYWKDYVAMNTDSDTTDGLSYYISTGYVWVYELDNVKSLKEIEIDFSTLTGYATSHISSSIHFEVYTSDVLNNDLFNTAIAEGDFTDDAKATFNFSTDAKYIAIVAENLTGGGYSLRINNIAAYGAEETTSPEEPSEPEIPVDPEKVENLLLGNIPVAFYTSAKEAYEFDWKQSYVSAGDESYTGHGYLENTGWERRANFVDYLELLTDGDDSQKLTIADEDGAKGGSSSWVCIVYELPTACDVTGVEIVLPSWDDKADIFLSSSRSDIFDASNMVASVVRAESKYTTPNAVELNKKDVKFVGVYVKDVYDSGISEIKVFGTKPEISENLISGKAPVAAYPVDNGTTKWAYRPVGMNSDSLTYFGQETRPATSENESFVASVVKFTDGFTATSATIKNEYGAAKKSNAIDDDILMVYKLDELSLVDGISLFAGDVPRNAKVYLANSYASLLNDSNLVYSYTSNSSDTGFSAQFEEAKEALYVGFVFECDENNAGQPIQELCVYGSAYAQNNYSAVLGDNLVNSNANIESQYLYNYLVNMGNSDSTLLGAEINITTGDAYKRGNDDNYLEYLENKYGVTPAIVSTQWKLETELYKEYYDEGSIPLIAIPGASSPTVDNYEESTTGFIKYYDATYTPSSREKELYDDIQEEVMKSYRDQADFFEELEASGVKSYIVRPFIEMNLNGFYGDTSWGNDTTKYFKNVWQQMVDYFVNERQLKGIIFAFAPSAFDREKWFDPMDYYPGDEYVDIIAPTVYCTNNDGNLDLIADYDELIATGKPFGISEVGVIKSYDVKTRTDCMNLLNSLKTVYPTAAFANLWYGSNYDISVHDNAEAFINDDYIVDAEEMQKHQYGHIGNVPVKLYTSADYNGDCTVALLGEHFDITTYKSIKIDDGYMITFIDKANDKWYFSKDIADLTSFDVADIASIKIEKIKEYTVYDINNDGKKDVRDLVRLKKFMVGISPETNPLSADIDTNGKVNAADLSSMRIWLLNN